MFTYFAQDGGVRLISAVTGAILTIIYPMATYQVRKNCIKLKVFQKCNIIILY